MRHLKSLLGLSCVALASITLASCSSDLPSDSSTDVSQNPETELSAAAKDQMLQRLGRGLALALKDQAVRTWVSNEIAASPYVEYRIPIRDKVVNESGRAEMKAIGRQAALTNADVAQLRKFPDLELYLPIESQRASWRGGTDIQVAVRRSSEDYTLFQTDGSRRVVPENYLPDKTTLVLAVSEIDYGDRDSGLRGGRNTGDAMLAAGGMVQGAAKPGFSMFSSLAPDPNQWTRSFSHFVINQLDGGIAGDDEMEIFANVNGSFAECRRYTGLKHSVQYFRNVNANIGISEAVALAVPGTNSDALNLEAWEDDANACVKNTSDDFYGSRVYRRTIAPSYNVQYRLCIGNGFGQARIGVTEYVNGGNDFNSPSSVNSTDLLCP
jgi:hypothetical protein